VNQHRLPSPFRADRRIAQLLVPDRLLVVKNALEGSAILGQMDPIVLYVDGFWNSPYAFSVFVTLQEKGLPFETREVNLHEKAQKAPDFQAKSVTARVPVLEQGAFRLSESSAIVEYLEETFAPPRYAAMLPAAPRDRARARQIMAWIRSDLMPIREERATHTFFYKNPVQPLSRAGWAAAEKLIAAASAFIPEGRTSLFDAFSIADADLAMMLMRLVGNGDPVPAKLRDFVAAQWQRPSVRAWVDHERAPYVPY
jgi:glutathione S-transferase